MSKNSLLEAPIASDRQAAGSYHSSMDGNGQLRQAPAPDHQWHQPYPAGPTQPYPPAAAPTSNRRWIPAAIISAGIIVAGAVVGGAVMMNHGNKAESATVAEAPGDPVTAGAANSGTCKAWATSRSTIAMIPSLPEGWDWDTPNIDRYIGNKVAATNTAVDLFASRIGAEPADVAAAANDYVAAKRKEMGMLTDRTYNSEQRVVVNDALVRLNQACGLPN